MATCPECRGRGVIHYGGGPLAGQQTTGCPTCGTTGQAGGGDVTPFGGGFFWLAVGLAVALPLIAAPVVMSAVLWMAMSGPLRSMLESSPASAWVAEGPGGGGEPLLVAGVTGVLVFVAVGAVSGWRRRVARRAVLGLVRRRRLLFFSLVRSLVLVGGVGLIIALGGIAAGLDRRQRRGFTTDDATLLPRAGSTTGDGTLLLREPELLLLSLIPLVIILGYTLVSNRGAWNRAAGKLGSLPPRSPDPVP